MWLTAEGVEGVPLWIEGGGIRWRLDSGLRGNASGDCNDQGRADWPAWSPDGKLIAFFGSPESTGQRDFARLDVPFHLYLMDAGELEPRVVMDDLLEPRSPVWSPDSKLLAFSVIRGPNQGVWLYEPAAERRIRVSRDKISWLAWSPKGNELAAITDEFDAETAKSHNRIVILDVTAPVG